ncbi:MAG: RNA polymerase sigma factor [Lunatimonas sp.]|uniref:RNA polymerase sigma factor n=1 Tax=Lunatimonas sp. TaxID=2060141 RepID=UPI00263B3DE1|nr:RNA polymerase sigma factor [Lunatimonas sp.]MCC5936297.1 RNA polymerase sigma factor [Lunatimonas sp.]
MFVRKIYSEADLIKKCLGGDRKAQRTLYELYSGKFLAVCRRYVKDSGSAEDIMIEGFMKIFEHLPQYRATGSFEGWMRKIMVTQSLLHIRNNRALQLEVPLDEGENGGYIESTENLESEDLLRLIDELPLGYRMVFNLYAIEGYSHKEIQELLGISESTSKSQLSRARATLRDRLKAAYEKEKSHGR